MLNTNEIKITDAVDIDDRKLYDLQIPNKPVYTSTKLNCITNIRCNLNIGLLDAKELFEIMEKEYLKKA